MLTVSPRQIRRGVTEKESMLGLQPLMPETSASISTSCHMAELGRPKLSLPQQLCTGYSSESPSILAVTWKHIQMRRIRSRHLSWPEPCWRASHASEAPLQPGCLGDRRRVHDAGGGAVLCQSHRHRRAHRTLD